jgi:hypothetical protein
MRIGPKMADVRPELPLTIPLRSSKKIEEGKKNPLSKDGECIWQIHGMNRRGRGVSMSWDKGSAKWSGISTSSSLWVVESGQRQWKKKEKKDGNHWNGSETREETEETRA